MRTYYESFSKNGISVEFVPYFGVYRKEMSIKVDFQNEEEFISWYKGICADYDNGSDEITPEIIVCLVGLYNKCIASKNYSIDAKYNLSLYKKNRFGFYKING